MKAKGTKLLFLYPYFYAILIKGIEMNIYR